MAQAPQVTVSDENGTHVWILQGDWTLDYFAQLPRVLLEAGTCPGKLDAKQLGQLDSSGIVALHDALGTEVLHASEFSEEHQRLIELIVQDGVDFNVPPAPSASLLDRMFGRIGHIAEELWQQQIQLLDFMGKTLGEALHSLPRPRQWRTRATLVQIEQVGVDAIPIVALLTFLVGAVVAFLGATVLSEFGATIYTVSLVGFSFLREFGVLLAAILMAGRTASAFTAQLGSMKANEEIDALQAQGLSPINMLVLPRVMAMLISLPALTLLAMVCGILGGLLVCWVALDISPALFFYIFARDIDITHLWVGLIKAPVFAIIIALIGCLEGFKVRGSAQSVGEHTTSSVVQAIFMVILLDALFALLFMELGW